MYEKKYGFSNLPKITKYLDDTFKPEDEILKEIRERCEKSGMPAIQVCALDALHLEIITRSIAAKKVVEIGTLGGYSTISIARGLSDAGKLFTFENSPEHAAVANETFKKHGFDKKIKCITGPALSNLDSISEHGPFDLVFIDADKVNYINYFAWAKKNLRLGGILLADNTFAWDKIANTSFASEDDRITVTSVQKFNAAVAGDSDFRSTLLPTGEGLTFAVKIK